MLHRSTGAELDRTTATRRSRSRIAAGALALATAVGLTLGAAASAQGAPPIDKPNKPGQTVEINLVTVNDFHGRIE